MSSLSCASTSSKPPEIRISSRSRFSSPAFSTKILPCSAKSFGIYSSAARAALRASPRSSSRRRNSSSSRKRWTPIELQTPVRVATRRPLTSERIATRNRSQTLGMHRDVAEIVLSVTATAEAMAEDPSDRPRRGHEVVIRANRSALTATFPHREAATSKRRDAIAIDRRLLKSHRALARAAAACLAAGAALPLRPGADCLPPDTSTTDSEAGLLLLILVLSDAEMIVVIAKWLVAVLARAAPDGRQLLSADAVPRRAASQRAATADAIHRRRLALAVAGTIAIAIGAAICTATTAVGNLPWIDAETDAAFHRITTMDTVIVADEAKADVPGAASSAEADRTLPTGGVTALPNLRFHPFVADQLMFWKMTFVPPLPSRPNRTILQRKRCVPSELQRQKRWLSIGASGLKTNRLDTRRRSHLLGKKACLRRNFCGRRFSR